ncbi:hypothetical protein HDU93_007321 [Gonapodya sp. JEL0774]|nr:hypothetical protein HDU93_007321 [Gonapodya sp. JEL0774]
MTRPSNRTDPNYSKLLKINVEFPIKLGVIVFGAPFGGKTTALKAVQAKLTGTEDIAFFYYGEELRALGNSRADAAKESQVDQKQQSLLESDRAVVVIDGVKTLKQLTSTLQAFEKSQRSALAIHIKLDRMADALNRLQSIQGPPAAQSRGHRGGYSRIADRKETKYELESRWRSWSRESPNILAILRDSEILLELDSNRSTPGTSSLEELQRLLYREVHWLPKSTSPIGFTHSDVGKAISAQARSLLRVDSFALWSPSRVLLNDRDLKWLMQPGSYHFYRAFSGNPGFLFVTKEVALFGVNSQQGVWTAFRTPTIVPDETILAGTLVTTPNGKKLFVCDDIVLCDGKITWHLQLPQRAGILERVVSDMVNALMWTLMKQIAQAREQPFSEVEFLVKLGLAEKKLNASSSYRSKGEPHPSVGREFDSIYKEAMDLEAAGLVERTCDEETGLEIFNYRQLAPRTSSISLYRGLVLHPAEKRVITHPFVRFFESNHTTAFGNDDSHNSVLEQPTSTESEGSSAQVEATSKVDGSLVIVFKFRGKILTSTRRRMNSEQALAAKSWIYSHCSIAAFQEAKTYLFELVGGNNQLVVQYPFEGLVLLAVVDENGLEWDRGRLVSLASALQVPVTPMLKGPLSAFREDQAMHSESLTKGATPVREGWVIKFGNGLREKLVYDDWKEAWFLGRKASPLEVWKKLRTGKFDDWLGTLPLFVAQEALEQAWALMIRFRKVIKILDAEIPDAVNLSPEDKLAFSDTAEMELENLGLINVAHKLFPLGRAGPNHVKEMIAGSNTIQHFPSCPLCGSVMDSIRPDSQSIPGYSPSPSFKQNWSKGWQSEVVQISSQPKSLPLEIIIRCMEYLPVPVLLHTRTVCRWWEVASQEPSLQVAVTSFKIEILRRQEAIAYSPSYKNYNRSPSPPDFSRRSYRYTQELGVVVVGAVETLMIDR